MTTPVVTGPEACSVVSAPSDGDEQVSVTGELDRGDNVGDVSTAGDHGGPFVDHAVPDGTYVVVVGISRTYDGAEKP